MGEAGGTGGSQASQTRMRAPSQGSRAGRKGRQAAGSKPRTKSRHLNQRQVGHEAAEIHGIEAHGSGSNKPSAEAEAAGAPEAVVEGGEQAAEDNSRATSARGAGSAQERRPWAEGLPDGTAVVRFRCCWNSLGGRSEWCTSGSGGITESRSVAEEQ